MDQTELRVNMRWQGLAANAKAPSIDTRVVKLADLQNVLPAGVQKATPKQRRQQIAERQRYHDVRYASA